MERAVFRISLTSLFITASTLTSMIGCDDSSDDAGEQPQAEAGASSGGTKAVGGASATGGKSSTGGSNPSDRAGAPGNDGGTDHGGAASRDADGGEAGAGGAAPCVPEPPTLPADVPEAIVAPEGVTLLRSLHAVGTQNYRCTETPPVDDDGDATYAWVFIAPVADLFNSCGIEVGSHFAVPDSSPPVPVWKYEVDGSSVNGARVDASPVDGAIPELLLEQVGHAGAGVFAAVSYVQRLDTVGGAAPPAAECDAEHVDAEQNVGYSSRYYFYSGP